MKGSKFKVLKLLKLSLSTEEGKEILIALKTPDIFAETMFLLTLHSIR